MKLRYRGDEGKSVKGYLSNVRHQHHGKQKQTIASRKARELER